MILRLPTTRPRVYPLLYNLYYYIKYIIYNHSVFKDIHIYIYETSVDRKTKIILGSSLIFLNFRIIDCHDTYTPSVELRWIFYNIYIYIYICIFMYIYIQYKNYIF